MKLEYATVLLVFLARAPLLIPHAMLPSLFGGQHVCAGDVSRARISIFNDDHRKFKTDRSGEFGDEKKKKIERHGCTSLIKKCSAAVWRVMGAMLGEDSRGFRGRLDSAGGMCFYQDRAVFCL